MELEKCHGYESLKQAVMKDVADEENCFNPEGCNFPEDQRCKCCHRYCDTFKWVIDRARHYAEKTGLEAADILDSWEEKRSYWYMNFYQECEQPEIKEGKVRVFDTLEDVKAALGKDGFRCPKCSKISKSPYECNHCDWKVYGLLGDLGKGIYIYCKERVNGNTIFMPVAWENKLPEAGK